MIIENLSEPNGQQTEFLLKSIASRLSGRSDCRKVNYKVTINHTGITMEPFVYVFPNRYKRQEADKIEIVTFIHQTKMHNALMSNFIFGVYEYQLSIDGKRRRWRKVE